MKDDKRVKEFFDRFNELINQMKSYGNKVSNEKNGNN